MACGALLQQIAINRRVNIATNGGWKEHFFFHAHGLAMTERGTFSVGGITEAERFIFEKE